MSYRLLDAFLHSPHPNITTRIMTHYPKFGVMVVLVICYLVKIFYICGNHIKTFQSLSLRVDKSWASLALPSVQSLVG